jgi:succinylglutamate desuccinylase
MRIPLVTTEKKKSTVKKKFSSKATLFTRRGSRAVEMMMDMHTSRSISAPSQISVTYKPKKANSKGLLKVLSSRLV